MSKIEYCKLKELQARYDYLLEKDGFTEEVERIGDILAWYCVTHNISVEEYNNTILK